MKHLIRSKGARTFLSTDGEWVADCCLARDFRSAELAISEVQKLMLRDVELVLIFGPQPSEYDVTIPLLLS